MEEEEGSQDEETQLPEPVCKPLQVSSLRQHCLLTLIRYRDALRDIGHVDHETVRQLLSHCSKENLATIEDNTLSGSGRELVWYTWHMWHKHYVDTFGEIRNNTQVKLKAIRQTCPADYVAPVGISAQIGDYRQMFNQRQQDVEERSLAACSRLKSMYEDQKREKEARATESDSDGARPAADLRTSKLPASKRQRTASTGSGSSHVNSKPSAWAGSNYSNTGSKSGSGSGSPAVERPKGQVSLIKQLGIIPTTRPSGTNSSSKIKILPKVTVTHTRTTNSSVLSGTHQQSNSSARQQPQNGKVGVPAAHQQRQEQQQGQQLHSKSKSSPTPGQQQQNKHPPAGPTRLPSSSSSPSILVPSIPANRVDFGSINLTFKTAAPMTATAQSAAAVAAGPGQGSNKEEVKVVAKFAGSGSTKSAQQGKPKAALPGYGLSVNDAWHLNN